MLFEMAVIFCLRLAWLNVRLLVAVVTTARVGTGIVFSSSLQLGSSLVAGDFQAALETFSECLHSLEDVVQEVFLPKELGPVAAPTPSPAVPVFIAFVVAVVVVACGLILLAAFIFSVASALEAATWTQDVTSAARAGVQEAASFAVWQLRNPGLHLSVLLSAWALTSLLGDIPWDNLSVFSALQVLGMVDRNKCFLAALITLCITAIAFGISFVMLLCLSDKKFYTLLTAADLVSAVPAALAGTLRKVVRVGAESAAAAVKSAVNAYVSAVESVAAAAAAALFQALFPSGCSRAPPP